MIVRLALHAMATRFELVLPCDDARDEPALRAAGEAALEEIAECEQQLSAFRSDSLVSHVNRVGHERSVVLDQDTFALFEECAQVRRASEGALDVCLGNALRVHGFRESNEGELPGRQLGSAGFELDPATWSLRLLDSQAALDLGAVGKGHALELAGRSLREGGVERALLHGGTSSVLALGAPPDADAWNVALEAAEDAPRVAAGGRVVRLRALRLRDPWSAQRARPRPRARPRERRAARARGSGRCRLPERAHG